MPLDPSSITPPYIWFGGKRRIAPIVWRHFGDVDVYIEPFFGGGSVFLRRPFTHRATYEVINDLNGYVVNFWRAVQADPDGMLPYVDWPVSDLDKHARQKWLVEHGKDLPAKLEADPHYYDVKIAGWWAWGVNANIGTGWCKEPISRSRVSVLSDYGMRQFGATDQLREYLRLLQVRIKRASITCVDWERAAKIMRIRPRFSCGLFLDPPYSHDLRDTSLYSIDSPDIPARCRAFALSAVAENPKVRIALCGYEGEHNELESHGWRKVIWTANQSYTTSRSAKNTNRFQERIWFSPGCLFEETTSLFEIEE